MENFIKHCLAIGLGALILVGCGGSGGDGGSTPNDDLDSDGIADSVDNCPAVANTDQQDSDVDGSGDACDPLDTVFAFDSQIDSTESAVSYSGQTFRHVLIADLTSNIRSRTEESELDAATFIADNLDFYFRFEDTALGLAHGLTDDQLGIFPGTTYGDISSGKDLVGKIAGNDPSLIDGEFFGWETGLDADPTPEEFVDYMFAELAAQMTDGIDSTPIGSISTPYVTAEGIDYSQLIQKFLLGAVAFSQGTADYLQTDWSAENIQEDDDPFSASEHNWDESFGYFGAPRDYESNYTDNEIADGERKDSNNDGNIDLRSEYAFGASTNCAKRDRGSTTGTDFSKEAFDAYLLGRRVLNNAAANLDGDLTADQLNVVETQASVAAVAWEKCIAATVIHYINETSNDLELLDANSGFTGADHFTDLAKHWSEMKGFALGLQFSPFSPFREDAVSLNNLRTVLSLMQDAPIIEEAADILGYVDDLMLARDHLQNAYDFNPADVANW